MANYEKVKILVCVFTVTLCVDRIGRDQDVLFPLGVIPRMAIVSSEIKGKENGKIIGEMT